MSKKSRPWNRRKRKAIRRRTRESRCRIDATEALRLMVNNLSLAEGIVTASLLERYYTPMSFDPRSQFIADMSDALRIPAERLAGPQTEEAAASAREYAAALVRSARR